jgi:von Willebrand factor A domain-containing protein 7
MGNAAPNPDVGKPNVVINRLGPGDKTCAGCVTCIGCFDNIITDKLTSGYYSGENRAKPNSDKCSHGGPLDFSVLSGGINKDSSLCNRAPHFYLHFPAAAVAKEATKQFIRQIRDAVTPSQIKLLLGVGPTLTISIDTTGSMGSIIQGVKNQAIQIVNNRLGTDEEPSKYVLAPFNDPGIGPVTVTSDPDTFKAAISALFASGGGDCPELSMGGMLQGLSASDEGGVLFMFTDASAKDSGLAGNVASLAASKDVKVFPILFGSCSPIDPGYVKVANDSGGELFFLSRAEAGTITQLADLVVRSNAVDILSVADTLAGAPKTYAVPVDSTLSRVTFILSGPTMMTINRPDGTVVGSTDPGVTVVALTGGKIVSITNPVSGMWMVTINGVGDFALGVSGVGTLDLTSFRFVEAGGRPDHEGFYPIVGMPEAGAPSTVDAVISGDFSTAAFDLRSKTGVPLAALSLTRGSGVADSEFFGDVSLPNTAFLPYVTGLDQNGKAYQRVIPSIFKPQTVKVIAPDAQDLGPNQTVTYTFQVKNLGAAESFRVSAADDKGFFSGLSPTIVSLGTGEQKDVQVTLRTPGSVPTGTSDVLTVTAQGLTSGAENFAIVTSRVTNVLTADLTLALTATPSPVVTGSDLTYALTVTNNGPGLSQNVVLTDTLFAGVTFKSLTFPPGWLCSTPAVGAVGTVTCTAPSLAPGASAVFDVVGTVVCATIDGTPLQNSASVSSTTVDPSPSNNQATAVVTASNPAPQITGLSVNTAVLWPPNHKMVDVLVGYGVSDNCGFVSTTLSISSNEAVNGSGDGNTSPDWVVVDAHHVQLRAERAGGGPGRIYSITVTATDSSGKSSSRSVTVTVPANQG